MQENLQRLQAIGQGNLLLNFLLVQVGHISHDLLMLDSST